MIASPWQVRVQTAWVLLRVALGRIRVTGGVTDYDRVLAHQHRLIAFSSVGEEELAAGDAEQQRCDGLGGGADHLLQAGPRHGHGPQPVDERDLRVEGNCKLSLHCGDPVDEREQASTQPGYAPPRHLQ